MVLFSKRRRVYESLFIKQNDETVVYRFFLRTLNHSRFWPSLNHSRFFGIPPRQKVRNSLLEILRTLDILSRFLGFEETEILWIERQKGPFFNSLSFYAWPARCEPA
jgi:hypothetical protein